MGYRSVNMVENTEVKTLGIRVSLSKRKTTQKSTDITKIIDVTRHHPWNAHANSR